jgi:hypothetical protein
MRERTMARLAWSLGAVAVAVILACVLIQLLQSSSTTGAGTTVSSSVPARSREANP